MEKNNKNIRMNGDGWSARAIAIGVPSRNIDVTINIKKKMTTNEADEFADKLKSLVNDWHQESRVLSPEHFILNIAHPTYPVRTRVMPMSICIDISLLSRTEIKLGDESFKSIFESELNRLIGELGLEM